jgi:hypothetical protein
MQTSKFSACCTKPNMRKYSTSLQLITYKLGKSWNLMQLTEASTTLRLQLHIKDKKLPEKSETES